MSQTQWNCEKCKATGVVDTPKGTDFYMAVAKIAKAHKDKSPDCKWDSWKVRVSLVDKVTEVKDTE
jgi:hypothetical protein